MPAGQPVWESLELESSASLSLACALSLLSCSLSLSPCCSPTISQPLFLPLPVIFCILIFYISSCSFMLNFGSSNQINTSVSLRSLALPVPSCICECDGVSSLSGQLCLSNHSTNTFTDIHVTSYLLWQEPN